MALRDQLTTFITDKLLQNRNAVLRVDESLLDRGVIDSVGLISLVAFLEQEAGVRIPDDEIVPENFETIESMEAFVQRLRTSRA